MEYVLSLMICATAIFWVIRLINIFKKIDEIHEAVCGEDEETP